MTGRFMTEVPASTEAVLADVGNERERQFTKWGPQHHPDGTSPDFANERDDYRAYCDRMAAQPETDTWLNILREEAFEAFAETDPIRLRKELIQVAAVAVSWVEDLDSRAVATNHHELGGEA